MENNDSENNNLENLQINDLITNNENIVIEIDKCVSESDFNLQTPPPPPKIIFIIPYRDRLQQLTFFLSHMKYVLEDMNKDDYKLYIIHQTDNREFNRGAIKNIGFLAIKNKYPNDYQNMTFVFNDVDTMPFTKNFLNYDTTPNVVKHFYGYNHTLGGIVSIKGSDFERINGFPNYWAWGFEDNELQFRVLEANMQIDRSNFYPILDKNILQLKDGLTRLVNRNEFERYINRSKEGIQSIHNLTYNIIEETQFIDVHGFLTDTPEIPETNQIFDIRNTRPFKPNTNPIKGSSRRGRSTMKLNLI
jgi:hypothetical protein